MRFVAGIRSVLGLQYFRYERGDGTEADGGNAAGQALLRPEEEECRHGAGAMRLTCVRLFQTKKVAINPNCPNSHSCKLLG